MHIGAVNKDVAPLGLGCSIFNTDLWDAQQETTLLDTMEAALAAGINHFDTASGYGNGASEQLVGRFLQGRREQVFLASKAGIHGPEPQQMLESVQQSLERLRTDVIDLYYIHWPRQGMDLRPVMEGLELARQNGLVRAVGVSNFSVAQMQQAAEVGKIDAHELPYNLFWRFAEEDILPYCRENHITVVTYSSIAHGILTGKFPLALNLPANDQRNSIVLFEKAVWPHVHAAVEELKALAAEVERPLMALAVRWSLAQAGIGATLVGANSPAQAAQNAEAMQGEIPGWALARMTDISDRVMAHIPNTGNPYRYYP